MNSTVGLQFRSKESCVVSGHAPGIHCGGVVVYWMLSLMYVPYPLFTFSFGCILLLALCVSKQVLMLESDWACRMLGCSCFIHHFFVLMLDKGVYIRDLWMWCRFTFTTTIISSPDWLFVTAYWWDSVVDQSEVVQFEHMYVYPCVAQMHAALCLRDAYVWVLPRNPAMKLSPICQAGKIQNS